jgi:hypothetical protein
MARIETYANDGTLDPADKWIGTDGAVGSENGKTKNYTVNAMANYTLGLLGAENTYEVEGGAAGTQPTFSSDPLFSGSYVSIGSLVHFQIQVAMTNITNFGTGQYYMKLPFASKHAYMFRSGCLHDASANREYHISAHVEAGSDIIELYTSDTQGNNLYDFPFTSVEPITLNQADNFHISGVYIKE